jgi:hypothetical protein
LAPGILVFAPDQPPFTTKTLHVSPPSSIRSYYTETGDDVRIDSEHADRVDALYAGARDIQLTTTKAAREAIAPASTDNQ